MIYLKLFLAVLLVNVLPAFVPPTWTVLVYFLIKYDLLLPIVVFLGVSGATLGRYLLSRYIDLAARWLFNAEQMKNISYLGQRLGKTQMINFLFTFAYSLTPLSTTALFVAAGVAEVKMRMVLLGFALGRSISYTILGLSADVLSAEVSELAAEGFSWESASALLLTFLVFFFFILIDWKSLLEEKRIRLHFRIWRWNKP